MAGTLQVENLIGPTTGANTNLVRMGSGQTFIGGPGSIIQYKRDSSYASAAYSFSASVEQDLPLSLSITPILSDSRMMIRVTWNMGTTGTSADCGFALRRNIGGSSTGYVQGSTTPDSTRGRFTVGGFARNLCWWIDDAAVTTQYQVLNQSVLLSDVYSGTAERTYTFTGGSGAANRTLYWNRETNGSSNGQYGGGNCSIEIMEIVE